MLTNFAVQLTDKQNLPNPTNKLHVESHFGAMVANYRHILVGVGGFCLNVVII
jgi:hypothetical protein